MSTKVKKSSTPVELDDHTKKIMAVRAIMKERELVREAGNFVKSDQLRDALKARYDCSIRFLNVIFY